ncbi:quercetin dioxygenase-like cupin family protein [Pseudomonas graminis]|uniref:cupin domain-containing protein n=1 Tax=Pseudomonas graminis TaxID=158627 RepID=UPI0010608A7A|nr:cupin domain-containing protein [Pseudomonas graminis]TDV58318.1 quercetin dioxygenase-like cupin family protein [Pseudomonas graminis]
MKPLVHVVAPLYCLAFAGMMSFGSAQAHDAEQEKVTVLEQHPMLNAPGKEAMVLTVEYTPGQASIAHSHSGSAIAYVLEGEVISRVNDGKAMTYKAGQTWYEPAGSGHYESRNASATKPAKLLVFILLDDKADILTPLPK